jgi:hypothetical protein
MPGTASRSIRAAVLLPVLLFSLAATSYATWRCRMDGVARAECCCPKDAAPQAAPATNAIGSAECCLVERHRLEPTPTDLSRTTNPPVAVAALTVPVGLLPLPPAVTDPVAVAEREPGRPPGGRAIVVGKHAFLI